MIRGVFYIEAQGNSDGAVQNSLQELVRRLGREKGVKVEGESFDEVTLEDKLYSSVVEVDLAFPNFSTYLLVAIKYGPSAIEIAEPKKLLLDRKEFLEALGKVIEITKALFEKHNIGYKFLIQKNAREEVGLSEEEIEELLEQGALRTKIIVESKGKTRQRVVRDFVNIVSEDIFVNKVKTRQMMRGQGFDGLVGIEAFMHEPKTLFDLAVKHRPVLVELIDPGEIELNMLEIQDIGVDLAGVFFEAAHKLRLK
ncbi:MAG: hypothetical protein QF673_03090 [Candidatus Hydrothermarchaeota archaeon]|nr:hypothetical protein [Candidatus Hydrothermarchaeota archaeon]